MSGKPLWPHPPEGWEFSGTVDGVDIWLRNVDPPLSVYLVWGKTDRRFHFRAPVEPDQYSEAVVMAVRLLGFEPRKRED